MSVKTACVFFVVLLFGVMLFFSSLTITPLKVSPYVTGTPDKVVNDETELRNAIDNAQNNRSTVIAFGRDITLTSSTLTIPADKNITLTSNKTSGHYKLTSTVYEDIAASNWLDAISRGTITVNGVLKLDGVNLTHDYNYGNYQGRVVRVSEDGHFIIYNGLISSNSGGVFNYGTFVMYGGTITGNTAEFGGGVYNRGTFDMFGGEISGNTAKGLGGGVYNEGTFTMSGGTISGNSANQGGGVYNQDRFTMSNGEILSNTGYRGGGVGSRNIFVMKGGVIANNTGHISGGGVYALGGVVEMSGGEIFGNTAEKGGGVHNLDSKFSLSGTGMISGNKATNLGGGICNDGDFTMIEGTISGNSASSGGGVYIGYGEVKLSGGKVFGNTANQNDNIHNENGKLIQSNMNIYVLFTAVVMTVCVVVGWLVYFREKNKNINTRKTKPNQHTEKTNHTGEQTNEQ